MLPESLEALKFIAKSKSGVTRTAFMKKFAPHGEALLQTVFMSHVDEVKGKLVLNQAGASFTKVEDTKVETDGTESE
jgi:hypothetical protein